MESVTSKELQFHIHFMSSMQRHILEGPGRRKMIVKAGSRLFKNSPVISVVRMFVNYLGDMKRFKLKLEKFVCKTQVMPPCPKPAVLTPCPILTHDPQHIQSILETNV